MPVRIAGLRGRLPVKPPAERFALRYLHEYTGSLPAPAYPIDIAPSVTAWGMDGNGPDPTVSQDFQGVGDCTFAGREHAKRAKAATYGETETMETSAALVAEYLAYDHGQDNGAVISDLLLTWYKASRILAFAPVDHTDVTAMDSAMQQFHGLYVGVDLTDDADDLFENGEPWTVANGETPDPDEGHCIVKVGADGREYDDWVTWGARQESTRAWSAACIQEAWVIITSEDEMDAAALANLRADIDALGGHDITTPPSPTPTPVPVPPADADAELWQVAGPWCAQGRSRPDLVILKAALEDWAAAKGY